MVFGRAIIFRVAHTFLKSLFSSCKTDTMKTYSIALFFLLIVSCKPLQPNTADINQVNQFLDAWHQAASNADYSRYFDAFSPDGIFVGTDATEYWTKQEFEVFAKPFFDRGKAWDFKAVERHVYFSQDQKTVWFDELLSTWMKGCRGSGVLVQSKGKWHIKQYVLSMTIPNDNTNAVIQLKEKAESILLQSKIPKSAQ